MRGVIGLHVTAIADDVVRTVRGAGSRRFTACTKARVGAKLHRLVLDEFAARAELDWSRCAISVNIRTLKKGNLTGPNPVDRGKYGSKIHLVTERTGQPSLCPLFAARTQLLKRNLEISRRTRKKVMIVVAARSTIVKLVNQAALWWVDGRPLNLRRTSVELDGGKWTTMPPQLIGNEGQWESESNGFMTGTEGRVTYQIEDVDGARIGEVTLHWDNPYYGANSYDESVTPAATPFPVSGFTVLHAYGEGDNAFVEFKLGSGHCDLDVDGIFFCVTSSPITVETDRFAAIWEQAAGPSWSALHGLAGDAYQARFDELVGQGYRPVQISGYGAGGDRFAAVFEQRDGPPFVAFHGLAGDAYQARFDELVGQGYRLTQVSGY